MVPIKISLRRSVENKRFPIFVKGVCAQLDMKEYDAKQTWTIALDIRAKTTQLVLISLVHMSVLVVGDSQETVAKPK